MMSPKRMRGFTLIELMIAIVIIGILAAVAYPGYQNSVRKSRRATAQGDLMAFAALMERSFTATNTYLGNGTIADVNADGIPDTGPPPVGSGFPLTSPMSGGGQVAYNLAIAPTFPAVFPVPAIVPALPPPGATTYTLIATPVPGPQVQDGVLTLNSVGQRFWDRNNNGAIDAGENTWDQ